MDSNSKEVKIEFPGLIKVFKDGSVERFFGSPHVPPTLDDPETGVSSKDVVISDDKSLSARLYLPKLTNSTTANLPILLYFHGGAFCLESAFSYLDHRYMNILASKAQVLIVSVEYRLAPEHPLPTAYQDSWEALSWATSLSDPWLANHADLQAVFLGGDSAGANIVHHLMMKANAQSLNQGGKILGALLSHPYFLDDKDAPQLDLAYKVWNFVYPDAPGGSDSPFINPMAVGAPSLKGIGCNRLLVVGAEKDELRDTNVRYYEAVKKSGFEGKVELYEVEGEGHCFHIFDPHTHNANLLFECFASFLRK